MSEDILSITLQVRKELGYPTVSLPKIISVRVHEDEGKMYVLCGDRPDRAVLMGPGGRVLKELMKRLNVKVIVVRALTDIIARAERIRQAIERARKIMDKPVPSSVKKLLKERLIPMAEGELNDPIRRHVPDFEEIDVNVAVAFSGGVDSAATLVYAKMLGLHVISITANPGPFIIPSHVEKAIKCFNEKINVDYTFVKPEHSFDDIISKAMAGHAAPCKRCHDIVERTVYDEAFKRGAEAVFFGDLLPTGCHSIRLIGNGIRVNLPAFLALTKTDTIIISKQHGHPNVSLKYGCPLLRAVLKRHKHLRLAAIQRVLRETRAGVLEPNQALKLIKSVIEL
ncbi:MAG: hypothetical protein NDF55_04075 [archaeon GB-1867-005]|nr:hypothetical protein [Candidatus Culexmicrobium cathedralense]